MSQQVSRSSLRYYGQHGEDYLLWEFFDHKPHGFFVDVGAFDGRYLSNSLSFEEQGWKGVCVEPHPKYHQLCREQRPASTCVQVACTAEAVDELEFFAEPMGLYSGLDGGEVHEADVSSRLAKYREAFSGFEKVRIPGVTVSALLEQYLGDGGELDFLSVDVEGTEVDVLKGAELERWKPRVLLVEQNSEAAAGAVAEYLRTQSGYREARSLGVNTLYTRNEADAERLREIRIRCAIEKVLHPLGESHTFPANAAGLLIDEVKELRLREQATELETLRRKHRKKKRLIREAEEQITQLERSRRKLEEDLKESREMVDHSRKVIQNKARGVAELKEKLAETDRLGFLIRKTLRLSRTALRRKLGLRPRSQ